MNNVKQDDDDDEKEETAKGLFETFGEEMVKTKLKSENI